MITKTKYFILFFVATVSISPTAKSEESLPIGVLACLSGACAEWGSATRNGLLLAQEKLNLAGGILGKRLEFKFEDTNEATGATQAVTAFRSLRSKYNIKFFIGPNWTPAGLALAPIAGAMDDVLVISPSLGVAEFNESAPNLFNTMMHSETATQALAKLAIKRGWKRAAIFSSQQPWEYLQGKVFEEEFVRQGGEVVIKLEPLPDVKDLNSECLKIVSSKPDGIFLANLIQESIAAKRLRTLKYGGPLYAAFVDQTRIDEASGSLEGAISAQSPEATPEFTNLYVTKFGVKPSGSADTAYDALMAISMAVTSTSSTDPGVVRDALLKVEFDGASGRVKFDNKGGIVRQPSIVQIINNSITKIAE